MDFVETQLNGNLLVDTNEKEDEKSLSDKSFKKNDKKDDKKDDKDDDKDGFDTLRELSDLTIIVKQLCQ